MLHNIKKRNEGFTIIEVMIVLAIAGLIMLIVFLAVPALQRNSRNTQRKNDVSSVLAAVSNYISNNGGTLPTTTAASGTDVVIKTGVTGANTETAKLGFYAPANVTIATAAPATFPDEKSVVVVTGFNCNGTNTDIGVATPRTAAALYTIESGVKQCQEQ